MVITTTTTPKKGKRNSIGKQSQQQQLEHQQHDSSSSTDTDFKMMSSSTTTTTTATTPSKLPITIENCFEEVDVSMHIQLPPMDTSNLCTGTKSMLDRFIFKYKSELGGVIISYYDVRFIDKVANIFYDCPYLGINIKVKFLLFKPFKGQILNGVVKRVATTHISVLVFGIISASISRSNLNRDFIFDHSSNMYIQKHTETKISVGTKVNFKVIDISSDRSYISIHGDMTDLSCTGIIGQELNKFKNDNDSQQQQQQQNGKTPNKEENNKINTPTKKTTQEEINNDNNNSSKKRKEIQESNGKDVKVINEKKSKKDESSDESSSSESESESEPEKKSKKDESSSSSESESDSSSSSSSSESESSSSESESEKKNRKKAKKN
eukprot:gene6164-7677_t